MEKNELLAVHASSTRTITCHVPNLSLAHSFNFDTDDDGMTKIEVVNGWHKVRRLNY